MAGANGAGCLGPEGPVVLSSAAWEALRPSLSQVLPGQPALPLHPAPASAVRSHSSCA